MPLGPRRPTTPVHSGIAKLSRRKITAKNLSNSLRAPWDFKRLQGLPPEKIFLVFGLHHRVKICTLRKFLGGLYV